MHGCDDVVAHAVDPVFGFYIRLNLPDASPVFCGKAQIAVVLQPRHVQSMNPRSADACNVKPLIQTNEF